jgi:hypothetical protein
MRPSLDTTKALTAVCKNNKAEGAGNNFTAALICMVNQIRICNEISYAAYLVENKHG